jgi:NADH dehydrogenase [ubiquinone] 1 alpha subcomplex assembly factor 5
MATNETYKAIYGQKNEKDGLIYIPATFQIIYMIGWKPHENQPKPLKRGTAKHSLKDINNLDKLSTK